MIFLPAISHMHIFNMLNICEKFQIDCLETLGEVDYTNLLPNIEASEICLSPKCRNFVKNIFLLVQSHMHIFIMLITSVQSFKLIA